MNYKVDIFVNLLWITNWPFPKVSKEIGAKPFLSQGWLLTLAHSIADNHEISLSILCISHDVKKLTEVFVDKIHHYIMPAKRRFHSDKQFDVYLRQVYDIVKPDMVHLFGTEYSHGEEFLTLYPKVPSILTIQGIMTRIGEEYYGGLSTDIVLRYRTLRENLGLSGMYFTKKKYMKQARVEQKTVKMVKYVTGRTLWDESILKSINPGFEFFYCNWDLREEFYVSRKWRIDNIQRHSIYTSFASYPLKGLHILLRAIALIIDEYPDIIVKVPGVECDDNDEIRVVSGYTKYIKHLIRERGLQKNVCFLGQQKADDVISELLKSHAVVVPSAIEGDSATLGEGQFLGVPCIASFRGGMTDMIENGKDGLYYDFNEAPVLASLLKRVFSNDYLAVYMSGNAVIKAERRYDKKNNLEAYLSLYRYASDKFLFECNSAENVGNEDNTK